MIAGAFFAFTLWLAFAFNTPRDAFAWLGPFANAYGHALVAWPFFAVVEGTIGMEFYGWLWAKATKRQSAKRIGIV